MTEEVNLSRRRFLGGAAITLALAQFGTIASGKTGWSERGPLSAFDGVSAWLNSQSLTAAECGDHRERD